MVDALLERIATFVTRRRAVPLLLLGAFVLGLGSQIPQVENDPSPEPLQSAFGDQAEVARAFEARFGAHDQVVLVLVTAPDVLTREVLDYQHRLARHFEAADWVARVDGLTVTSLARRSPPAELTLDALEDLPEKPAEEPPPVVLDALETLAAASPERFPNGLASIGAILEEVEDGPVVEGHSVTSDEAEALRRALRDAPLVEGRLVAADRRVALVALTLADSHGDFDAMTEKVGAVESWLEAHPLPDGASSRVGGIPHLRKTIVEKMVADQLLLVPLTLLVCVVLLYASYRWWPATVLPLGAVGITAVIVVGGMGLVGEPMNILNNIIPPLLIIIGVSDSIHLLNRYREELRATGDTEREGRRTAARAAVRSMTVACFLTSLTTAVGLGSLVAAETPMLQRFGVTAAIGVLVAYVVTIVFLPPLLIALPAPPLVPRRGKGWLEERIEQLTAAVLRWPWVVVGGTAALLAVSVWGATALEVDSALLDQFDAEDDVYRATMLLEEGLGGVRPLEVMIEAPEGAQLDTPAGLHALRDTQTWLHGQDGVLWTTSPADLLGETWALVTDDPSARDAPFASSAQTRALETLMEQRADDPLARYLTEEGRVARLEVRLRDVGAKATGALVTDLESRLEMALGQAGLADARVRMTGEAFTGAVGIDRVVDDLIGSLLTAIVIIFALLTLLFGSLRLGLLSVPPNVIPLVFTMAWMAWRGIPLSIATVIIFSISIGLAVDGTIHVLARFREERREGRTTDDALLRSARGTGRAIVVSSVTLMLGFAVMLASEFVPVRRFGELVGATVTGCLVATIAALPALLKVAARHRPSAARSHRPGEG